MTFHAPLPGAPGRAAIAASGKNGTQYASPARDDEINVASPGGGHKAEFVSWRWEPMKNLPKLIVPFKRPVYERVVKEFAKLAGG